MSKPQLKFPLLFTIIAVIVTMSLLAPGPADIDSEAAEFATVYVHAHKTVLDDEDEGTGEEGTQEYMSGSDVHADDLMDSIDDDVAHLDEDGEFQIPGTPSAKS
jgi:hypothetical protein